MTRLLHSKNYCKKAILSQYTIETSKSWPEKCSESTRGYRTVIIEAFPLSLLLNYNIRHQPDFSQRTVKSVYYGTESLGFLGPNILELFPAQLKNTESLETFKSGMKKWEPIECPCRL